MAGILSDWPVRDFLRLTGARVPIIQAPMAGAGGVELAAAVIRAGGVGSLPCAMLTPEQVREQVTGVRAQAEGPLNLNFFCHQIGPAPDEARWHALLAPFYAAEGVAPPTVPPPLRRPFDAEMCAVVEALQPEVVSFHLGMPEPALLTRVRKSGAAIFGNATTLAEAKWLFYESDVDAIIAQGFEAGGHAGYFLDGYRPVGTMALLSLIFQQIGNACLVPIIAAGGIGDGDAIAGALTMCAAAVQLGSVYLHSDEATISQAHRAALGGETVVTNLFSGGLARGVPNRLIEAVGPVHPDAPPFPYASAALADLRVKAEREGRGDYSPLWAGQASALSLHSPHGLPSGAEALTTKLWQIARCALGDKS